MVADVPHLREKTAKVGTVARAAAIFRVEEIFVYPDEANKDQSAEINFVARVLRYLSLAPHIRRMAIKIEPSLRYVGILPPLHTPNHPPAGKSSRPSKMEIRDGWVMKTEGNRSIVDAGLAGPVIVYEPLRKNSIVTIRIVSVDDEIRASIVDPSKISIYWGYRVAAPNLSLGRLLKSQSNGMIVSSSRYGRPIRESLPSMKDHISTSSRVSIFFGSPKSGLHEIARREGVDLDKVSHFVVNSVPGQGVQTVRTEEAVTATLAVLNANL
jgi:hypothetical protein